MPFSPLAPTGAGADQAPGRFGFILPFEGSAAGAGNDATLFDARAPRPIGLAGSLC